jgi:hypothetical protein
VVLKTGFQVNKNTQQPEHFHGLALLELRLFLLFVWGVVVAVVKLRVLWLAQVEVEAAHLRTSIIIL